MAGRAHFNTACSRTAKKGLSANRLHKPKQPGEIVFPRLVFLVYPRQAGLAPPTRGQVSAEPND